jgi:transketolase
MLYRYVDNRGVTVLDRQGVPPEYADKGYEVLNRRGRVVKVVPPPMTAEQLQQAQAEKAKAAADAQLLNLYSSLEDVDRAKARRLAELDALVDVANSNILNLNAQQNGLQKQAADQERAGRVVPQTLIDQLADLRAQQRSLQADIERNQAARVQSEAQFAIERVRVKNLLSH